MNFFQLDFQTDHSDQREMLIALLDNAGFEGFEEINNHLRAFIRESAFEERILNEIVNIIPVKYDRTVLPEQNWNAQWESSFDPIVVDNFVAIRAHFHKPVPNVNHEVIITPKMSFGTGHHATTYLMIEQMETLDLSERSVLDFGTGTGILAILASKMGAKVIMAIDNDDWSIENAKENFAANSCNEIQLQKVDYISFGAKYDIILANINLNVILANIEGIANAAKPGAKALLSGFLISDEANIKDAVFKNGFMHVSTFAKDGWICIIIQKI